MPVLQNGGLRGGSAPSPSPSVRAEVGSWAVPFDRDKFTQLIKVHGYNVCWEKAAYCPFLRGPSPKDHDINCTTCSGGFIYFDPKLTKMTVQSLSLSQQYYAYGRFDSGRAQITAFPEFRVSFWDRITLCDARVRHRELVKRSRSTLSDKMKFPVLSVEYIAWGDDDVLEVAQLGDYTIADDGSVTWQTTHRPGADTFYSIVYFYRPVYIVLDLTHHLRDETAANGQRYEFPNQFVGQLAAFSRDERRDETNEGDTKSPFPVQGAPGWEDP